MASKKKTATSRQNNKTSDFKFDEKVASIFDDMLNRSIPFYQEAQTMALNLAKPFVKKNSRVYDLGCSTGNTLKEFAELVPDKSVKLFGIDSSEPMLKQAREKLGSAGIKGRVTLQRGDLSDPPTLQKASVVFLNYTLQFVRPLHREALIRKIYDGLLPNGCLILLEKVLGNDSLFNRMYIELYYDFKKQQGYTDKEINQKREALENVLIPYRMDENISLLKKCGFEGIDTFFKWYNFAGIIAVKQ